MKAERTKERGTYIGGHQIGAIMGMHPYMNVGDVYMHAVEGKPKHDDGDKNPIFRRGLIVEPGFCEYIKGIRRGEGFDGEFITDGFFVDDSVPFFAGTVDMCELVDGEITHIHEVTVSTSYAAHQWGADGTQDCAKHKWVQNQWYQGITGADGGTVWVMFADTGEIRRYPLERKQSAITSMRNDGEKFWLDYVIPKVKPMPDDFDIKSWLHANESLDAMFKGDSEMPEVTATEDLKLWAVTYVAERTLETEHQNKKKEAAARIKAALKDAPGSSWDEGRVTWKKQNGRSKVDYDSAYKDAMRRLVDAGIVDADYVAEHEKSHTKVGDGYRVLRVHIKKGEDK